MKIGPGVSELWGVENRPLPLTRPMAYTTACTTVQAVISSTCFVDVRIPFIRHARSTSCIERVKNEVQQSSRVERPVEETVRLVCDLFVCPTNLCKVDIIEFGVNNIGPGVQHRRRLRANLSEALISAELIQRDQVRGFDFHADK